jgi:hypothetical protein
MRPTFTPLVLALLLPLLSGCTTTKPATPAYVPTFRFSPPETAAPGSAGVLFAVINARFSKNEDWTKEQLFATFSRNLSADFETVLHARGYTVRGPFGSIEEMTYPDKQGSDLALSPTLELDVTTASKGILEKARDRAGRKVAGAWGR